MKVPYKFSVRETYDKFSKIKKKSRIDFEKKKTNKQN